ncbi:MAG: radical SAM protein [Polyangia bacterium]|nr:radical SAM protein [Polyangia bacterium]
MLCLDLNLGRRCNLRCVFCLDGALSPEQRQWIPLGRAREELEEAHRRGIKGLGLIGGEPTAHPEFFEVLAIARGLGFERIAIYTNGYLLGEPAFADRVVGGGVTRVGISMHGHTPELEDHFTGRSGAFEQKLAGLRRLAEHRKRGRLPHGLAVNPVINRLNLPHLSEMVPFFFKAGVNDLRFNFLRSIGRAQGSRELTPRYRDAAREAVAIIVKNERRGRHHITFGDFPFCLWPWEILGSPLLRERYIGEFHDLRTDVALIGSPRQPNEDLQRFNWADRRKAELKLKFPSCEGCAFFGPCEGVYACYVEIYGNGEFGAVSDRGVRLRRR